MLNSLYYTELWSLNPKNPADTIKLMDKISDSYSGITREKSIQNGIQ